jgi:predicted secreted protein
MTAVYTPYLGKDFTLSMGDGAASETFYVIGGFRTHTLKINQGEIDTTTKDGARWRQLVAGGIRSVDVSGGGVFEDGPWLQQLMYKAINTDGGYKGNFKITFGNGATLQGSFFLKAFSNDGPHDKEHTFTVDLASAGAITLTEPAPTISTVTPSTDVAAGGAAVAIVGSGFMPGAAVAFGATAGTSVVVVDGTHITCVAPAHTAATVDVTVTNADAQVGTKSNGFTFT